MNKIRYLLSLLVICAFVLGACTAPESETIIETVIVEKEGETIVETVEVVVTEVVEVEVIVDPTECNLDA
ncbi:MAG: hypothetical protein DRJ03_24515, partial [Chloroflexi bacterium]